MWAKLPDHNDAVDAAIAPKPTRVASPSMDRNHFQLDLDGVLVTGRGPSPGAIEFIERL